MPSMNLGTFEEIKHVSPRSGVEFWFARELQQALEYTEWRNFTVVIEKAKTACEGSNIAVSEHFVDVNKSSPMPNGGIRKINDITMTQYGCYLVVQNCDPSKEVIARAQTYFVLADFLPILKPANPHGCGFFAFQRVSEISRIPPNSRPTLQNFFWPVLWYTFQLL